MTPDPKFHIYGQDGQRLTSTPLSESEVREFLSGRSLTEGKGEADVRVRQILQG